MGFEQRRGALHCDGVNLATVAEEHGTPLYVYSADTLRANIRGLHEAFAKHDPWIAYSVKACSNLAICQLAVNEGCGLDIVSGGELARAQAIGADPTRIIFAGVGKTDSEIDAALRADIGMFNVESIPEVAQIDRVAGDVGRQASIALRVNPNVKAETHRYITTGTTENKFGIDFKLLGQAIEAVEAAKHVTLTALHCHIGSQILDAEPYRRAAERVAELVEEARGRGHEITHVNFGGGHGIAYQEDQTALAPERVAEALEPIIEQLGVTPILEPGRSLVGPAGALITRVINVKRGVQKTFVIVDGAMNDFLRPSLYSDYHRIAPVSEEACGREATEVDVVGPVCESGDFLAQGRSMPLPEPGELLALLDAGAYGFVMASNYNTRPRPCEVVVLDGSAYLVRRRESVADLLAFENVPGHLR
jgi:diaminopimelate decarboxylase